MKDHDWFKAWFRAMPVEWQAGIWEYIREGTVFIGDFKPIEGGKEKPFKILFMPADLADMVVGALKAMAQGE